MPTSIAQCICNMYNACNLPLIWLSYISCYLCLFSYVDIYINRINTNNFHTSCFPLFILIILLECLGSCWEVTKVVTMEDLRQPVGRLREQLAIFKKKVRRLEAEKQAADTRAENAERRVRIHLLVSFQFMLLHFT